MVAGPPTTGLGDTTPVLTVKGLVFAYPSRPLFAGWSASFSPGLHLVRGGDGSGKTSLLRLLAADLPAQAGELQLASQRLPDNASAYRQQVFRTDPTSDAFDTLMPMLWFERLRERYPAFDMDMAGQLLERLFLQQHLQKTGHMMSTGSRRKVWLAAALASGAAVALLDQPFAALDAPSIRAVTELLRQAAGSAGRVIVLADYEAPAGIHLMQTLRLE
jgi:ABC-type multidrug transport system ATPase subunit